MFSLIDRYFLLLFQLNLNNNFLLLHFVKIKLTPSWEREKPIFENFF